MLNLAGYKNKFNYFLGENLQNNTATQIKQKLSIVNEIRETVKLTKKGKNYLGLCPFHKEKSPSFTVDESKGFFHCFGCNASGDIFEFVMKAKNLDFKEAITYLANKAGISLQSNYSETVSTKNKDLLTLLELAKDWFINNLFMPEGKKALDYLERRGISKEIIQRFEIGFAPPYKDAISNYLLKSGFLEADIIKAGLRAEGEPNNYDVFRNRIIFPIKNRAGKIIAFGGRALNESDKPKYLNSKDSNLFHKKLNLYGLNESVKNLKEGVNIILVEGYIDVIALHQKGFNTAVAPLGTAVSKEQLQIITGINKTPVVCLDGDEAGRKASLRALNLFLEILEPGMIPKFIFLPEKEDPDSFINHKGAAAFYETLENSKIISEVIWDEIVGGEEISNISPEIKALYLSKLTEYCENINHKELKQEFISFFKNRLSVINKFFTPHQKNLDFISKEALKKSIKVDYNEERGYFLLAYVIACPAIFDEIDQKFAILKFSDKEAEDLKQTIVDILNNYEYNKEELSVALAKKGFHTILHKIMNHKVIKLSLARLNNIADFLAEFEETYGRVSLNFLEQEMIELKAKLKQSKTSDLLKQVTNLQLEINKIRNS